MTWSGRAARGLAAFACAGGACNAFAADAAVSFDRPGIPFSTDTLPPGLFAWEQGLPDFEGDSADGVRTRTWLADSLLRVGIADGVELQLGADSLGRVETRGPGAFRSAVDGGGDSRLGAKWKLPLSSDRFALALLATHAFATGRAPVGSDGDGDDLGATATWTLRDRSVSLYLDRDWSAGGAGWMSGLNVGLALSDAVSGYVEAGAGSGADRQRVAGAGIAWNATPRLQFDASFLRGLDRDSPDWQGGFGVSWAFGRRR